MKRSMTNADREAQKALRKIWREHKEKTKETQAEVATALGWKSQSSFSQYLTGRVPIGAEAAIAMAEYFSVDPRSIRADLDLVFGGEDQKHKFMPVVGRTSEGYSNEVQGYLETVGYTPGSYALFCDESIEGVSSPGDFLLVAGSDSIQAGDRISIKYTPKGKKKAVHRIAHLKSLGQGFVVVDKSGSIDKELIEVDHIVFAHPISGIVYSRYFHRIDD